MLYGVDVHGRYQAGISFATLKAQGYTFAAVKATQGTFLLAPQFVEWTAQIRAAGMVPGAYHWIDNRSTGAAQARYFYNRVKTAGGPEGMLVQLDNEDTSYPATLQITKDWAAEWAQVSGGHPFLMYTGGWWWRPRGWDGHSITPYLWDSHYLTADLDTIPDDPAAFAARIPASWWNPGYGNWPTATFLQFTSRGDAGGLANNVDLNATRLTLDQLLALTTAPKIGDDMAQCLVRFADDPAEPEQVWLCDGQYRRRVKPEWLTAPGGQPGRGPISNYQVHGSGLLGPLGNNGAVFVSNGDKDVWGLDIATLKGSDGTAPSGPVDLSDEAVAKVADAVLDEQHERLAQ